MSTCEIKEKQKDENRRNFPLAAMRLDEIRNVFGDGVRLAYAEENGKSVGKEMVGYFMPGDQWMRLSALIEFDKKRLKKK